MGNESNITHSKLTGEVYDLGIGDDILGQVSLERKDDKTFIELTFWPWSVEKSEDLIELATQFRLHASECIAALIKDQQERLPYHFSTGAITNISDLPEYQSIVDLHSQVAATIFPRASSITVSDILCVVESDAQVFEFNLMDIVLDQETISQIPEDADITIVTEIDIAD